MHESLVAIVAMQNAEILTLRKQVGELEAKLEASMHQINLRNGALIKLQSELEAKLAIAVEALHLYADADNWQDGEMWFDGNADRGGYARQALAQLNNGEVK